MDRGGFRYAGPYPGYLGEYTVDPQAHINPGAPIFSFQKALEWCDKVGHSSFRFVSFGHGVV
jgi:hypothetical protein